MTLSPVYSAMRSRPLHFDVDMSSSLLHHIMAPGVRLFVLFFASYFLIDMLALGFISVSWHDRPSNTPKAPHFDALCALCNFSKVIFTRRSDLVLY